MKETNFNHQNTRAEELKTKRPNLVDSAVLNAVNDLFSIITASRCP